MDADLDFARWWRQIFEIPIHIPMHTCTSILGLFPSDRAKSNITPSHFVKQPALLFDSCVTSTCQCGCQSACEREFAPGRQLADGK